MRTGPEVGHWIMALLPLLFSSSYAFVSPSNFEQQFLTIKRLNSFAATEGSVKESSPNEAASCPQNWTCPLQKSLSRPYWKAFCAMGCFLVPSSSLSASWQSSSPHPRVMSRRRQNPQMGKQSNQ